MPIFHAQNRSPNLTGSQILHFAVPFFAHLAPVSPALKTTKIFGVVFKVGIR
jgi:hypothetical protein